jgi:AraC-like DNA-binding protein
MKLPASESNEKISFARYADMPFLETMSVTNTQRCFSAFHETYTICGNLSRGGADWRYRGNDESGSGNIIMLMEPGETHRTVKLYGTAATFFVLHLDPAWIRNLARSAGFTKTPHLSKAKLNDPRAYAALIAFYRGAKNSASVLERESRLIRFLELMFGQALEEKSAIPRAPIMKLNPVRDYVFDNYRQKITLDDLAAVAGVTKFHLTRSFTHSFGLAPHAFLNLVRIARAREDLRQGKTITGSDFGFFDQSHFIQVFRKIMGVTPLEYAGRRRAK